jgi:hypothetical protein
MMRLCLTNWRGTSSLGLYRGLSRKTRRTPFTLRWHACSFDALVELADEPVILPVRYEEQMKGGFWQQCLHVSEPTHCIILFCFDSDGMAVVGDPANHRTGRVRWTREELRRRWLGEAFCMTTRSRQTGTVF